MKYKSLNKTVIPLETDNQIVAEAEGKLQRIQDKAPAGSTIVEKLNKQK